MLDNDANTAKSLALATVILETVFFAIGVIVLVLAVVRVAVTGADLATMGIITLVFMIFLAVGIVWLLLDFYLVYRPLAQEHVAGAETPSLVLGIIRLIIGGVIPGICEDTGFAAEDDRSASCSSCLSRRALLT